jgi:hypothetical protein
MQLSAALLRLTYLIIIGDWHSNDGDPNEHAIDRLQVLQLEHWRQL